ESSETAVVVQVTTMVPVVSRAVDPSTVPNASAVLSAVQVVNAFACVGQHPMAANASANTRRKKSLMVPPRDRPAARSAESDWIRTDTRRPRRSDPGAWKRAAGYVPAARQD